MNEHCRTTEALKEGHPEEPPDRNCYDCLTVLDEHNARWHFEQEQGYAQEFDEDGMTEKLYCDYCLHGSALSKIEDLKAENKKLLTKNQ